MATQLVRVRVIKNRLPHVAGMLPGAVKEMARKHAEAIFAIAQTTVPVASGELRDSGGIRAHGSGYNVGYTARHAPWVHDGTVHMEARPWLQLAAEQVRPEFQADVRYLRDLVMKAAT